MNPEHENQNWRHQRAAAHAGQADEQPHDKAGGGIKRMNGVQKAHDVPFFVSACDGTRFPTRSPENSAFPPKIHTARHVHASTGRRRRSIPYRQWPAAWLMPFLQDDATRSITGAERAQMADVAR